MKASLCILACDQIAGVQRLVRSIRDFGGMELEIVIGDNSRGDKSKAAMQAMADTYIPISDRSLWSNGFGPTKQSVVNAAAHDIVLIGDPDEEWFPWDTAFSGGVMATAMKHSHDGDIHHGRVFHRKKYRYIGLIHEELYHRKTRAHWSKETKGKEPFARITHRPEDNDGNYLDRKNTLYDSLLYRAYKDPSLRYGISPWWFESYVPSKLDLGWKPLTFAEWQEKHGGN